MNDQLIYNNYLLLLKSCVEVYVHGTLESTNQDVREVLKDSLDKIISMQNCTYQLMVDNGWYNIQNVSNKVIDKTIQSLESNS